MRNRHIFFLFGYVWTLVCLLPLAPRQAFAFGEKKYWLVGTSQAVVNPKEGAFIAGDKQNRRFSGVLDNLYSKAVVISHGRQSLALLTIDCIGLLYPQVLQIREAVQARIPVSEFNAEHLIVSSTHTHSGPDVVGIWGPDLAHSGVDPEYIRQLVEISAEQVVKAWRSRKPGRAVYASFRHEPGWVHNISEPGDLDPIFTVMRFRDLTGKTLATLSNFACHPTFLDAVNDRVSADYPAGLYRELEESEGGVHLFLQGSIGGWVQPEGEPHTPEQAYRRGQELARVMQNALQSGKPLKPGPVEVKRKHFRLPVQNDGFRQLAAMGVIKRSLTDSADTEVAIARFGQAMLATHPGETAPAFSRATRQLLNTKGPVMILGLSLDAMGYILKPEFFDKEKKIPHATYLCSMSVGPETGPLILKQLELLARGR